MNWFGWLLVAWWAVNALVTVSQVDKPRNISPLGAAVAVAIFAALIVGLLTVGTGR